MFIISEIFPQHSGNIKVAEQMILQSKIAGADAVKVQLYEANQFGAERAYLELDYKNLEHLKTFSDAVNIDLLATPFTLERLEWCTELKLRYLKVPSRMHTENPDLVHKILDKKITTFVSVPENYDPNKLKIVNHAVYLYCIPRYPVKLDEVTLPDFNHSIFKGISDHTLGYSVALYASAHGAQYLEKHFTLSHSFQKETEKAHLCAMTIEELSLIKIISTEFEIIRGSTHEL